MKLAICLLLTAVVAVGTIISPHPIHHYSFVEVGSVVTGVSYGHLVIPVTLEVTRRKAKVLKTRYEELADTRNMDIQIAIAEMGKGEIRRVLHNYLMIQDIFDKHANDALAKSTTKPTVTATAAKRPKRQLLTGLAIAGIMGVTTIAGLFTQGQIEGLKQRCQSDESRQQHMIALLGEEDTQQQAQIHNLAQARKAINQVNKVLPKLSKTIKSTWNFTLQNYLLADFNLDLDLLNRILEAAASHRLCHGLITLQVAQKALDEIDLKAKANGYKAIITEALQIYQLEASLSFEMHKLILLIHVPLAKPSTHLTLYKFRSFPFSVGKGLMANIIPPKSQDYLAFNFERTFYTMFSEAELAQCTVINQIRFCPNSNTMYPITVNSCLTALFFKKKSLSLKLCDSIVRPEHNMAEQISPNTYYTYNTKPETYEESCLNGSSNVYETQQTQIIKVPENCMVDLPYVRLLSHTHGASVVIKHLEYAWEANLDDMFHGLSVQGMKETMEANNWDRSWQPPLRHSGLFQNQLLFDNPLQNVWHASHFLTTGLIVILAIIVSYFMCSMYCRHRRKIHEEHQAMELDKLRSLLLN